MSGKDTFFFAIFAREIFEPMAGEMNLQYYYYCSVIK